jgi:hypothetical protein
MNEFWARLNSTERRFVVGVLVVFFLVINIVWVWPHFGDWSETKGRMEASKSQLHTFQSGTNLIPELRKQIDKYLGQGQIVPEENQALDFVRLVQNQLTLFGIIPQNTTVRRESSGGTTNNPFFVEQSETMSLDTTEKQLVDFLYSLGAGSNSLIRVKVLSVQPDQSHQRLNARVTLVASYQRKAIAGGGSAPAAGQKRTGPATNAAPNNAKPAGTAPLTNKLTVTAPNRPANPNTNRLPTVPGGPPKSLTPNKK